MESHCVHQSLESPIRRASRVTVHVCSRIWASRTHAWVIHYMLCHPTVYVYSVSLNWTFIYRLLLIYILLVVEVTFGIYLWIPSSDKWHLWVQQRTGCVAAHIHILNTPTHPLYCHPERLPMYTQFPTYGSFFSHILQFSSSTFCLFLLWAKLLLITELEIWGYGTKSFLFFFEGSLKKVILLEMQVLVISLKEICTSSWGTWS